MTNSFTLEQTQDIQGIVDKAFDVKFKSFLHENETFKKEIKREYADILHHVSQARQENTNVTTIVSELSKNVDKIMHTLLPNEFDPTSGVFNAIREIKETELKLELKIAQIDRERAKEAGQIDLIKWVIGGLGVAATIVFAYIINHMKF
jgi:predicted phosphoribosyltransferase